MTRIFRLRGQVRCSTCSHLQPPYFCTFAPRENLAGVGEGSRVEPACSDLLHRFGLQRLQHPGQVLMAVRGGVPHHPVLLVSPRVHLAVHIQPLGSGRQSQYQWAYEVAVEALTSVNQPIRYKQQPINRNPQGSCGSTADANEHTLPRSVSTTVWRLPQAICVTLAPSSRRCFTMQGVGCPLSLPCPSCRPPGKPRHANGDGSSNKA